MHNTHLSAMCEKQKNCERGHWHHLWTVCKELQQITFVKRAPASQTVAHVTYMKSLVTSFQWLKKDRIDNHLNTKIQSSAASVRTCMFEMTDTQLDLFSVCVINSSPMIFLKWPLLSLCVCVCVCGPGICAEWRRWGSPWGSCTRRSTRCQKERLRWMTPRSPHQRGLRWRWAEWRTFLFSSQSVRWFYNTCRLLNLENVVPFLLSGFSSALYHFCALIKFQLCH